MLLFDGHTRVFPKPHNQNLKNIVEIEKLDDESELFNPKNDDESEWLLFFVENVMTIIITATSDDQ